MNEKNLEALKNNLKYLGFGEGLHQQLETNIREKKPEFTLQHEASYNNKPLQSTLHFKQGNENEMYFFNRYEAKLTDTPDRQQNFYLDRGNGITTKEAFNLLEGRSVNKELVNKEGEKYIAWVQLDFAKKEEKGNFKLDRYHTNYGYDIEKALQQFPIKELGDPKQKEELIKSMTKGNQQSVYIEVEGKPVMHFIQAEPRFKDIAVFDKNNTRLDKDQTATLKTSTFAELAQQKEQPKEQQQDQKLVPQQDQKQAQQQAQKQEQQQSKKSESPAGESDDGPELKKKRNRTKGMKI